MDSSCIMQNKICWQLHLNTSTIKSVYNCSYLRTSKIYAWSRMQVCIVLCLKIYAKLHVILIQILILKTGLLTPVIKVQEKLLASRKTKCLRISKMSETTEKLAILLKLKVHLNFIFLLIWPIKIDLNLITK